MSDACSPGRRGRLAPTPTGLLHVGHARTFAAAAQRAGTAGLVLRIDDLDGPRCRDAFVEAAAEDLAWLGLRWTEGPDVGGPHGPYRQRERSAWYLEVWRRLEAARAIRSRAVSSVELTRHMLQRIDRYNPKVNASKLH